MRIALLVALVLSTAAPASAANGWWTFNRNTNLNSTLTWKWTYPPSPADYSRSWRAGSGTTMDECEIGRGWLPAGWYAQKGHWDHYDGSKVKGRVWWIQDKTCRDGSTRRTELFIHSEETASNGQSCSSAYDDPFCWEREADYYSNGCIKVSRAGALPRVASLESLRREGERADRGEEAYSSSFDWRSGWGSAWLAW